MDLEHVGRDHGIEDVRICRSVEEAVKLDGAFDVAIVDLMIGGDTTIDFARGLSKRGTPFIFATGYTDNPAMLADFGDVPVIPKPYIASQVVEALVTAVTRSAA
jgi:CheY-like chemotaxis protein